MMPERSELTREHSWDGLRAFLMLLGIPYHVALSYQVGQSFIVHSGEGVHGLTQFAHVIHLFRMPAFFVVAGYFAALMLTKRAPQVWLRGRFQRLGLPFVTSLVTLVPIMNLTCELSNFTWAEALTSWVHNSLNSGGYWVRHLWFIVVLLYFCTAASALACWYRPMRAFRLSRAMDQLISRHFIAALLGVGVLIGAWEAIALEAFYEFGLATMLPQQILRLDEVIIYAPWFVLGFFLVEAKGTMAQMTRFRPSVALFGLAATIAWLVIHQDVSPMTERFLGTFASLAITQILIAVARKFWDRPIPIIRNLTDASFVIYLFHLPFITLFVWLAQSLPLLPLVKAFGVMALSFSLSYTVWIAIRRSKLLSFFYEGKAPRESLTIGT